MLGDGHRMEWEFKLFIVDLNNINIVSSIDEYFSVYVVS